MVICCRPTETPQSSGQASNGVGRTHNEEVCHGTGERRRDLLDQVKVFLNEFDERPCEAPPTPVVGPHSTKRLGQYEEYVRKHCQSWMPPNPRAPLITSVQTHEVRPTEDFDRMRRNNSEYVTYTDARFKPPPSSCDCAKRNGLQDMCEQPECKPPTAQCLATNPGPCCPPSMGVTTGGVNQMASPRQRCTTSEVGFIQGYTSNERAGHFGCAQPHVFTEVEFKGAVHQHPNELIESKFHTYKLKSSQGSPPKGHEMTCFCKAEPDELPAGRKFICCPSTDSR